eukprot:gene4655-9237_t
MRNSNITTSSIKNRSALIGIVIGLIFYAIYVLIFKKIPSQVPHHPVEPKTILPDGTTAGQACLILKKHYHINIGNVDLQNVQPSALFHWKNLQCDTLLKNLPLDIIPSTDSSKSEKSLTAPSKLSSAEVDIIDPYSQLQQTISKESNIDISTNKKIEVNPSIEDSNSRMTTCQDFVKTYDVVPGASWGSLPFHMQKQWSRLRCDAVVVHPSGITKVQPEHNKPDQEKEDKRDRSKGKDNVKDGSNSNDKATSGKGKPAPHSKIGLPKIDASSEEWCVEQKRRYHVIPMQSWGSLPMNMVDSWRTHNCDRVFTVQRMSSVPLTSCSKSNWNGTAPLIAIMAGTTTRKVTKPSTSNLALFSFLLPSLLRTVDCGFRYVYVLGYDKGDPFYDDEANMAMIKKWFKDNVERIMKDNNIIISFKPVKVNNSLRKPGPVFNEMARAAYNIPADYFYRVNDDTELVSHWPSIFVKSLHSLSKPYGVVGPTCHQGNQRILTHDFVSRIHMEVFEMNYYPPELVDWWMDDWISLVYGKQRTFKAHGVEVVHHTGAHGKRYEVDQSNERKLKGLIISGREKIRKWLLIHGVSEKTLKDFDTDDYKAVNGVSLIQIKLYWILRA